MMRNKSLIHTRNTRTWTGEQLHLEYYLLSEPVLGGCADSYGVEVAKLAGLPGAVISRAREILAELESGAGVAAPAARKDDDEQMSMLDLRSQQVCDALSAITVETLTPIEAMNELYKLKRMLS